jgi:excisionase family DNA binding protein
MPLKLKESSNHHTLRSEARATSQTDQMRVASILGNSFRAGSIEDGGRGAGRTAGNTRPHQLLTVPEAADQLGLSARTLWEWLAQRRLECVKLGRAVRIRQAVIDDLIARGTVPARPR